MPKTRDLQIKVSMDSRPFRRSLRKIQWQLWWLQNGNLITVAVVSLAGFIAGLVIAITTK